MKKHLLLVAVLMACLTSIGQEFYLPCADLDYQSSVGSVSLFADGNQNKEPLIPLSNPAKRLTLWFDLLGSEGKVLNYTFIHCTNDWQPSDIMRNIYVAGFDYGRIDNFEFSRNTLVDYVHYELLFPNEEMMPVISGNYLLIVYEDDLDEDHVLFTRRFMVVEEKANISASVPRYCDDLSLSDTHQQLNLSVTMSSIMSGNVQDYAAMTIRQNGRWDNAVIGLKPTFVYPDHISYEHNPLTVFEATNQYRRLNFSNFYFQSENIAHIYQTDDYYVVDYLTCEPRAKKPYVTYDDIHGEKFVYIANEGRNTATEADYAWVNIFLRSPMPYTDEDVYVMGAVNDWRFDERNLMRYDYNLRGYLCQLLLKQGYYNFMFVTADRNTGVVTTDLTEGNYWDTFNLYRIYFYYFNAIKGYDELIGYTTVNSH